MKKETFSQSIQLGYMFTVVLFHDLNGQNAHILPEFGSSIFAASGTVTTSKILYMSSFISRLKGKLSNYKIQ